MITSEKFPYIKSLYVNDCYAYKNFNIELHDYKPFSHLILTGKNGSGKSTILRAMDRHIAKERFDNSNILAIYERAKIVDVDVNIEEKESKMVDIITVNSILEDKDIKYVWNSDYVYSFIRANRISEVKPVITITKEADFVSQLENGIPSEKFVKQFK